MGVRSLVAIVVLVEVGRHEEEEMGMVVEVSGLVEGMT